ncbi:MAG: toll/interleukin-1 receptor domain-containing protein [Nitrosopumilaceae archaeon]|nr:toll/interleukin-1 receptor domain-containing protein [Nitrosopumilaceae archaeon]
MAPIRVFISHPDRDRAMAAELKRIMDAVLMRPFLAHRDIGAGAVWREAIRREIEGCDMLVALVTPNFCESEYANQEVGAAWVLGKPILPVLADGATPPGFISDMQGVKYDLDAPLNTARNILKFAQIAVGRKGRRGAAGKARSGREGERRGRESQRGQGRRATEGRGQRKGDHSRRDQR